MTLGHLAKTKKHERGLDIAVPGMCARYTG